MIAKRVGQAEIRMLFSIRFFVCRNHWIKQRCGFKQGLFGRGPVLLAHLSGGELAKINRIGGIIGAWPDRGVQEDFLERGFRLSKLLLRYVAIADVTVGQKKELVPGYAEGRFLWQVESHQIRNVE